MVQSQPPLPQDRSHILTEQRNPCSMNLHTLSAAQLVQLIGEEDRTIHDAIARAAPTITAFIEAVEPGFAADGRLIYIGAGTSGRLGVLDASEMPPTFQVSADRVIGIIAGGDASLRKSSESREDHRNGSHDELKQLQLNANDAILGIAAGGTTPYVQGALEFARQLPSPPVTGLLCCTPVEHAACIDHLIVVETGPEIITGSTRMKAGTATKLVLNTISTTLMVRSGRVYENLMVDLRASNDKLRDRAARIIAQLTGLNREACFSLLDAAQGDVKTAIVMHKKQLDDANARQLLDAHNGRLDRVL